MGGTSKNSTFAPDPRTHRLSLALVRSFSRVLKEINRGGTAVVYSGIDLMQQKKVALKVMSAKHKKEGNLRAGR